MYRFKIVKKFNKQINFSLFLCPFYVLYYISKTQVNKINNKFIKVKRLKKCFTLEVKFKS